MTYYIVTRRFSFLWGDDMVDDWRPATPKADAFDCHNVTLVCRDRRRLRRLLAAYFFPARRPVVVPAYVGTHPKWDPEGVVIAVPRLPDRHRYTEAGVLLPGTHAKYSAAQKVDFPPYRDDALFTEFINAVAAVHGLLAVA